MQAQRPLVGVGVLIRRDGKVLLGKRAGAHGDGTWQFPGGHLEFGETVLECALRETCEETGMHICNLSQPIYTEDVFVTEHKHYITLFVIADWKSGEPIVTEPEKCEVWDWFAWNELPQPLFKPIENLRALNFQPFN